jgi:transposase InsO family protein
MPYLHEVECAHKNACPHLDGLSTTWVLGQYRRAEDAYDEHLRIIDRFYDDLKGRGERIRLLERENAELKAKLKLLHQRQFKANKKTDSPTQGFGSQKETSVARRWAIPHGSGPRPNAPIGPVAKSVALYLRYRIGIPYRKTTEVFRDLFGLSFVPAAAVGFDRKAAICGTPLHEDVREKLRVSDVVHADETAWRNDGVGHYAWFGGNEKLAYFHIDRHRSAEVATSILGEKFGDRCAAYNEIGRQWQSCLAHIITKAKEIKREHGLLPQEEKNAGADRFCDRVVALFKAACETGMKLKTGAIPWESAEGIEKQLVNRLAGICKKPLAFKPAETLRGYLFGPEQKYLFTFLRHPGVPPTNNLAEQAIRQLVIFRKICFGTRSESGLKTHSILPSLVQTARSQGVHPRQFLQTLLTADTPNAVWAADISYVWTWESWLYLAVVMDLYSRQIVGWAMDKRMQKELVLDALAMAYFRRRPARGLIHHSDRGSQYACHEYQKRLERYGMIASMSRKGDCWDNAPMERFFRSLKSERLTSLRFTTRQSARLEILDYIGFYNADRLHSSNGYLSPMDYEKEQLNKMAA